MRTTSEYEYRIYPIDANDVMLLVSAKKLGKHTYKDYPFKPSTIFIIGEVAKITQNLLDECCSVIPAHSEMVNGKMERFGTVSNNVNFKLILKKIGKPEFAVVTKTLLLTKHSIDDFTGRNS